jgi:hypothetical protein
MTTHEDIISFRAGQDRNNEHALSHTYAETKDGLFPMCGYGWNRSNGHGFSIFRGSAGSEGDCKLCQKRLWSGKPPVIKGFGHKTRWL